MKSINIPRRSLLRLAGAGCAIAACRLSFAADQYPSRPIRIVVPYAPGGGTDVVGRALAQAMSKELGQPIIIDNKAGGGTVIGSDLVSKSPPDGHTLLMTTSAIAINASLVKNLPYDTQKGFAEVALICHGPNVVVVRADSPYRTLQDIIKAAREKPGKLNYASSGNGSAVHLAAELLKSMAKIDVTHVPYRGAGPAYTDLLGGQVDMLFGTAGGVSKFVETGKMRAIAVTSKTRSPAYKDVPAVSETLPGYEAEVWYGVFAPGGTPAAVLARLNAAIRKAAEAPDYRARLKHEGLTVAVNTPQEMTQFMRSEEQRWRKVVTEGRITTD
ncbi:tripartite tricarboxylate transporter substrate binding protein [Variovorax rhizosphaerae]|uniref:Tripartite tricarboxylate transporter substrate binding protein n=1 Tax=Variovorax rhizosphaerae TaxID=1836200 RepID=A0ABU8WVJ0_9BURK